jgi:hypothetical protein
MLLLILTTKEKTMNKLNQLNDLFNRDSLEFSINDINAMITHYVQDGDYDLTSKSDVDAFIETYIEEEGVDLIEDNCCYDINYSLKCIEIKENSVVISVLSEEIKKECICNSVEAMLSLVGGV